MQIIRKHAIVKNGMLQIPVPNSLNNRQVEVNVVIESDEPFEDALPVPRTTVGTLPEPQTSVVKKANLGHLVGQWAHFTPEQQKRMTSELNDLRNSWERDIF